MRDRSGMPSGNGKDGDRNISRHSKRWRKTRNFRRRRITERIEDKDVVEERVEAEIVLGRLLLRNKNPLRRSLLEARNGLGKKIQRMLHLHSSATNERNSILPKPRTASV
jgi:hypothetical protein